MYIATACAGQCLNRVKIMKKKAVKHDQLCPFDGQVDLLLLPFIAECITNIKNKTDLSQLPDLIILDV